MGSSSLTNEAGLRDTDINIDGTALTLPVAVEVHITGDVYDFVVDWELDAKTSANQTALAFLSGLRSSALDPSNLVKTLNGRYRASSPYRGDGMPDGASAHTFAFWKAMRVQFTGKAGQQVFWLPRPDAFGSAYTGKTDQSRYGAIVTALGVTYAPGKTVYKATVVSTDVPTGDEVWISKAAAKHPDSGINGALFKLGTGLATAGLVVVDFIPRFDVVVTNAPLKPFEKVGREDQSLYLTEINP